MGVLEYVTENVGSQVTEDVCETITDSNGVQQDETNGGGTSGGENSGGVLDFYGVPVPPSSNPPNCQERQVCKQVPKCIIVPRQECTQVEKEVPVNVYRNVCKK